MKRAVISDIHGNLEALQTVLADIAGRGIKSMICLGDFVGYGASPNECIETTRPKIELAVAGNHDLAACGRIKLGYFNPDAAHAAKWTDVNLTPENREYLLSLPYAVEWQGHHVVHASPSDPKDWSYVLSPHDAEVEFEAFTQDVCLIGHSHYLGAFEANDKGVRYTRDPQIRVIKGYRYLVNVGSVGQPRDGDPRAAYLIYDDEEKLLEHVRLEYDIDAAAKRIRDAGLPDFLAERLKWGE